MWTMLLTKLGISDAVAKMGLGFIGLLLALVLILVIPNYGAIQEKLGIETVASLRVKNAHCMQKLTTAINANSSMAIALTTRDKLCDADLDAVSKQHTEDAKMDKIEEAITAKQEAALKKLKSPGTAKPNSGSVRTMPSESPTEGVADIQITSLWETYCAFNEHVDCGTYSLNGSF